MGISGRIGPGAARGLPAGALVVALLLGVASPGGAYTRPGRTAMASARSNGERPSGNVLQKGTTLSGNGRVVGFVSQASNIVAGDRNTAFDVFVRDLSRGAAERVSVSSSEAEGVGVCVDVDVTNPASETFWRPSLSDAGRHVAFDSCFTNLVAGDVNLTRDIFVRDRGSGTTARVSVGPGGRQANGESAMPSIDAHGRYVAFQSIATNLVAGDTNNAPDVFVHDTRTGKTERVSVMGRDAQAEGAASCPAIDGTGRYVAFVSDAALVQEDTNDAPDVYVRDLKADSVERVSVATGGRQSAGVFGTDVCGDGTSRPGISAGGRYVVFTSWASDLVPNDTGSGLLADVFVHDRKTRRTTRVSVTSAGEEVGLEPTETQGAIEWEGGEDASIDDRGRHVAFESPATQYADEGSGDTDIFVHDSVTGATTLTSLDSRDRESTCQSFPAYVAVGPSLDATGRHLSFTSCADQMTPGSRAGLANEWQAYRRDLGPALGTAGGLVGAGSLAVAGSRSFATTGIASTAGAENPGSHVVGLGADLIRATLAYRSSTNDLFVRQELSHLPSFRGAPTAGPGTLYGVALSAGGTRYQVRVQRAPGGDFSPSGGASFGLFRCDRSPGCTKIARLRGGYGTSGHEVVVALPLEELGLHRGGTISGVRAFTALGSYLTGPARIVDEIRIGGR